MENHSKQNGHVATVNHYPKLIVMVILSFICMYILMYSMVNSFANIYNNLNQFYMACLMTAPMIIIEMVLMSHMYKNKKANTFIILISSAVLLFCFFFIRNQTAISDKQFLKSMIPHHAAAILMVNETELKDPEIQKLAEDIISAQQKEIEFMKAKLELMENR